MYSKLKSPTPTTASSESLSSALRLGVCSGVIAVELLASGEVCRAVGWAVGKVLVWVRSQIKSTSDTVNAETRMLRRI